MEIFLEGYLSLPEKLYVRDIIFKFLKKTFLPNAHYSFKIQKTKESFYIFSVLIDQLKRYEKPHSRI